MTPATIALLPSNVIDRIAAGEVVERPASVVKELLENALDAGASEIQLSLKGGGISEIRIVDNGRGMGAEDARLCLIRHATSKIRSDDDLMEIQTLGFRGEALASIAAVSNFRLETGKGLNEPGFKVAWRPEGPEIIENAPRTGTLIVASELFGKVPARRKFLKAERTELNHIMATVKQTAMANNDVGFEVVHDGKTMLKARPTQDLRLRAQSIFGKALSQRLFPILCQDIIRVDGLLSAPSDAKATIAKLHLIINGRPVKDSALLAAIRQGFGPLLAPGHTPQGVVRINIPPGEVDVNVHPRKTEVRFSDPRLVFRTLLQATRSAVSQTPWLEGSRKEAHQTSTLFPEPNKTFQPSAFPTNAPSYPNSPTPSATENHPQASGVSAAASGHYSQMRFLGQVANSYWVLDDGTGLVLIDQHIAHELVLRKEIKQALTTNEGLLSQPLLFPESVHVPPHYMKQFELLEPELKKCGFDAEAGGKDHITLRGVPVLLRQAQFKILLHELCELITAHQNSNKSGRTSNLLACHAATRAGDTVSTEDAHTILSKLDRQSIENEKPHGRSVVAQIDYKALDKLFK